MYSVRAVVGYSVNATNGDQVSATPKPAAPTIEAKAGNGIITLTWEAPDDSGIYYWKYEVTKGADEAVAAGELERYAIRSAARDNADDVTMRGDLVTREKILMGSDGIENGVEYTVELVAVAGLAAVS